MDISSLSESVGFYFQQGLAPSTQKTYQAAHKRFYTFCIMFDISQPFPVSEQTLCCFASYLANEGLAPQSIKSYLAAVRSMQISLGLPDPRESSSLPTLKRVLDGVKRVRMVKGVAPRARLPVTATVLLRVHEHLSSAQDQIRSALWAIACTAFFGFFRLGELLPESANAYNPATHLSWGDVAVDSQETPKMVQIHLKKSKCDQFGKGVDVVMGKTSQVLCPVSALMDYMEARSARPGAFFLDENGVLITKARFVQEFRRILSIAGFPADSYAGHSFRIGAATTAAVAGIEDATIKTLGRWQSAAFLQYIRSPKAQLAAISSVLARSPAPPHPP